MLQLLFFSIALLVSTSMYSTRAECFDRKNDTFKILVCEKLQNMDVRTVFNITDPSKYTAISISNSGFVSNSTKIWRDFKNLYEFNITYSNLKTVPNDLFTLSNKIMVVNLGHNDIDNISWKDDTFLYAKKLVTLNLEFNCLSSWHNETFKELTVLDNLILTQNDIKKLVKPMFDSLGNLKTLVLDNNGIQVINDNALENLKKLRELFLHNNNLTKITANTFYGLRELRLLHLSDNQILTINSNALDSMPYLTFVYLSTNNIHFIDSQLFNGKSYTTGIWLNHNKIQSLPANLFKTLGNLEFLHLGYNNISHLEEHTFRGLAKVKTLFLDHNVIDYLHTNSFHYLLNVKYFDLSHNRISEVTSAMLKKLDNIHYLKFDRNSIVTFEDLPGLKNLIILDLSYNYINTIMNFKDCPQLSDLNLQHNNITEISMDNAKLKQINKIDLTGNPISAQSLETLQNSPYTYIFQMEPESDKCRCLQPYPLPKKLEFLVNDSFVANEQMPDLQNDVAALQNEFHGKLLKICLLTIATVVFIAAAVLVLQWRMLKRQSCRSNVMQNQEDILKIMYCKNESE